MIPSNDATGGRIISPTTLLVRAAQGEGEDDYHRALDLFMHPGTSTLASVIASQNAAPAAAPVVSAAGGGGGGGGYAMPGTYTMPGVDVGPAVEAPASSLPAWVMPVAIGAGLWFLLKKRRR